MYHTAEELIKAGLEGKWYKPESAEERDAIVNSISDCNVLRHAKIAAGSGQGGNNLRHYERDGYLTVHGFCVDSEPHPTDIAATREAALAAARALIAASTPAATPAA